MESDVAYTQNRGDIIYVGNLPKELTEAQLKTYFSQFGNVTKIRLMKSKKVGLAHAQTNRSKGYAFVKFDDKEVAKIAAETMDKYLIDGKSLKVHVKEEDQVVKHLFKRGKPMLTKKNRIKLMNRRLDSEKKEMDRKLEALLGAISNGETVDMDDDAKALVDRLSKQVERLKDKQKRFDTDLYDKEIQTYSEALETIKRHFKDEAS